MEMNEKIRLRAYYFGFSETGIRPIDLILCAVSTAGKLFHHTDQWISEINYPVENVHGSAAVDWIQNAADDAAEEHKRLIAERDTALRDLATAREECERLRERYLTALKGVREAIEINGHTYHEPDWNPDAHVEITLTVKEVRLVRNAFD